MSGLGIFSLPLALWTETSSWMRRQMERQERFLQTTLLRSPAKPAWASPSTIVLERPCLSLRDFSQGEGSSEDLPVLIVCPQVNHSYICDYAPQQSLVSTLRYHGHPRTFVIEWKSADLARAHETLDESFLGIEACIRHLGGKVHLVGLCQGGWMSLVHAALHPEQIGHLVLAAAPVDFFAEPGLLNLMARFLYPMSFYESLVLLGGGVIRGEMINAGFNNLRPLERYFGKYFDLMVHIDDPGYVQRFEELENWYSLHQNIPGPAYLKIVKELFKENRLVKGTFVCKGSPVDLKRVVAPLHLIVGSRDHVTYPGQLFAAADHVSSREIHRYTADAGHIGVFMSKAALRHVWPSVAQRMRPTPPPPSSSPSPPGPKPEPEPSLH